MCQTNRVLMSVTEIKLIFKISVFCKREDLEGIYTDRGFNNE
jgi:hypothetical protein